MHCLIVDDIPENLYMLQVILQSQGYTVTTAENGKVALRKAFEKKPDIVISDILMPIMDGFNLCRECKKNTDLMNIPFIFYTATYTDEKDKEFALNLGADLFLIKPLEPDVLLRHINSILEEYASGTFKPNMPNNDENITCEYNETLVRKLEKKMLQLEHEIASRMKAEENLRISEERFKLATKSGMAGVWDWDIEKDIFYIEPYLKSMLGYKDSEVLNTIEHWNSFIHQEDKKELSHKMDLCKNGNSDTIESTHRMKHRDGHYLWFLRRGHVLKNKQEKPVRVVGITIDITEDISARKEINMLGHVLKSVKEWVCITDKNGIIQYINNSMIDAMKVIPEDVVGHSLEVIFPDRVYEQILKSMFDEKNTSDLQKEISIQTSDGSLIPVLLSVSVSQDETLFTWIMSNLSDMKEKERQLRFAQKMESIGTMVSGIAHDFNNILFAIYGNTELVLKNTDKNSKTFKHLENILNASDRAKTLINQLLNISRGQEGELIPIDIAPLAKEIHKLMLSTLPSTINIKLEINCDNQIILADSIQIHQVLINLCTNASHAMEKSGGKLGIKIENADVDEKNYKHESPLFPGKYLKLSVSDTGIGIPHESMEKIFEPFFTTKPVGKGTGLGLSVVHGIVKKHNGFITVNTILNAGTTIEVFIPSFHGAFELQDADHSIIMTGNETILCVDDEVILIDMLEEMLSSLGYKTISFKNSSDALEYFKTHKNTISVIITDLTMPGLTGLELSEKISTLNPDIPIILCSGNKESVTEEKLVQCGISKVIAKPFSMKELSKALRIVIDKLDNK